MSSPDDMTIKERDGVTIARVEIENLMGIHEVSRLQTQVDAILEAGVTKLVLDLKHVHFIGSAVLGVLMSLHKRLKTAGGQLVLSHTENIDELLKVSRSDRIFQIAPDPYAAVNMILEA